LGISYWIVIAIAGICFTPAAGKVVYLFALWWPAKLATTEPFARCSATVGFCLFL
jgi:hypothetical protein